MRHHNNTNFFLGKFYDFEQEMFNRKKLLANLSEYLNTLNIIFYLTVGIPLVLFCITYIKYEEQGGLRPTTNENFHVLHHVFIPAFTIITTIYPYLHYRQQLKQKDLQISLTDKLFFLYQLSAKKYFFLFIANMLPVIGLFLTGEQLFAGLYAIALVAFSLNRPTPLRIFRDLKLNKEEQNKLINSQDLNEA